MINSMIISEVKCNKTSKYLGNLKSPKSFFISEIESKYLNEHEIVNNHFLKLSIFHRRMLHQLLNIQLNAFSICSKFIFITFEIFDQKLSFASQETYRSNQNQNFPDEGLFIFDINYSSQFIFA